MGAPSSIIIGYEYSVGMHMILFVRPDDSDVSILQIQAGEREIWSGDESTNTTISIDKPDLFGGRKKEGGVVGDVDFMFGEDSQTANSYLVSQLGAAMPGFLGVVSLVLNKVYLTAMSQYPKPWRTRVRCIPQSSFNPTKANIGGAANPVNMILDLIIGDHIGAGLSMDDVDVTSMTESSDTLFDELFGMSWIINGQNSAQSLIQDIMNYIDGIFYTDNRDGKFHLKLIRNDYDPETLPIFDESNIISVDEFERASYAELINEVIVTYTPQGSDETDAVSVQDLAGIQTQGGVISQTYDFPAINNAELASRVGLRMLEQKSIPRSAVKITVNRQGFGLSVGDVFKFSNIKLGIASSIFRLVGIDYGDYNDGVIELISIEDVFGLPDASYIDVPSSGWVDPLVEPEDATIRLEESTYYQVLGSSVDGASTDYGPETAFFRMAAIKPTNGAYINFQLYRDEDPDFIKEGEMEFVVTGTIVDAIAVGSADIVVTLTGISGLLSTVKVDEICYVGDELMAVISTNPPLNQVTLGRAVVDTVPAEHGIGERVWFFEHRSARTRQELTNLIEYEFKAITRTGIGVLPFASATSHAITGDGRYDKPYRPGNLTFGGLSFPSYVSGSSVDIVWSPRNRITERDTLPPYIDSVTSEPGVVYHVDLNGDGDGSEPEKILFDTAYASTTITVDITNDDVSSSPAATNRNIVDDGGTPVAQVATDRMSEDYSIVLRSVRAGTSSHQDTVYTLDHSGYGLRYGEYYGGG